MNESSLTKIQRICTKLASLWFLYPQQRIGQIISNYIIKSGEDCFYMEDDEFEKCIDDAIEDYKEKKRVGLV